MILVDCILSTALVCALSVFILGAIVVGVGVGVVLDDAIRVGISIFSV